MDIQRIIIQVREKLGREEPSKSKLSNIITELGVAEYIGLAGLLVNVWSHLFPRSTDKSPRCISKKPFSNDLCGKKLLLINFNEQECELIMICEDGHRKVKKTSL